LRPASAEAYRHEDAVVIGRVGAYCGAVLYEAGKFWASDNTLVASPVDRGMSSRFLYYLLKHADLSRQAGGAAQPLVTQTVLNTVELLIPSLADQRHIAGILSAYDDLIENCQRRIRILEDMAGGLYREWFVNLRFPGAESVRLVEVDSQFGSIPVGWQIRRVEDVATVNGETIDLRNAPEEIGYIDIASVSPGQIDAITPYAFSKAPGRARRLVRHGDVLWSCVRPNRRSFALAIQPAPNTVASTGFAILTAREVPFTFLYQATTSDDFVAYLTNHATGAAYPAVTSKTFEAAQILVPSPSLLQQFSVPTEAMAVQSKLLHQKVTALRRTRDLLLPRLLSGQISLGEAAEQTQDQTQGTAELADSVIVG
jgi:type I restriction enzyme S subunit